MKFASLVLLLTFMSCSHAPKVQPHFANGTKKITATKPIKANRAPASVTTGYGVCAVADQGVGSFYPGDVGQTVSGTGHAGYTVMDTFDLWTAKAACTDAMFDQVMIAYCTANPNAEPQQWQVATYDANGNISSNTCAASGCESHACPEIQFVEHTNLCGERKEFKLCEDASWPWLFSDSQDKTEACFTSYYSNHNQCEQFTDCKADAQAAFVQAKASCQTLPQAQRAACIATAKANQTAALSSCTSLDPRPNYQYSTL